MEDVAVDENPHSKFFSRDSHHTSSNYLMQECLTRRDFQMNALVFIERNLPDYLWQTKARDLKNKLEHILLFPRRDKHC